MQERTYNPAYAASLPVSGMIYPDQLLNRLKYYIFKVYNPLHPFFADLLLAVGIIHHEGRQAYLLGTLKEERKIDDLLTHLVQNGFGNHFIAWIDDGQVASLRLVKDFEYQYHIRIFKDGEVRGHYEHTPECHPISHVMEYAMSDRREDFYRVLGDWIDKKQSQEEAAATKK